AAGAADAAREAPRRAPAPLLGRAVARGDRRGARGARRHDQVAPVPRARQAARRAGGAVIGRPRPSPDGCREDVALAAAGAAALGDPRSRGAAPLADDGFRARGAPATADSWVALRPYRVLPGGAAPLPRQGGALRADEPLLFAYDNLGPAPYRYLMVFAV